MSMYNDPNQPPYGQQQPPYGQQQPSYGRPQQPKHTQHTQYSPPPFNQPQYGSVPPIPNYAAPQQQKKGSLRWLWCVGCVWFCVFILICGGCILTSVLGIGYFAKTFVAPVDTATQYYNAVKSQDYNKAYSYLNIGTLTAGGQTVNANQDAYTQAATAIDQAKGTVTSFSITSTNTNNNDATITVHVTRANGETYDVQLTLSQSNGTWKITNFDNI